MSYVYVHSLTLLRKVTDALGVSFGDLVRAVDIDPKLLKVVDATIASEKYRRLMDEIVRQTGKQDFGVLSGRVAYIEGFHLYMYLASLSDTIKEWLNTVPTASSFLGDLVSVDLRLEAEHFVLEVRPSHSKGLERCYISDHILTSTALLMDGCGVLPIKPVKVDLTYAQPGDTQALSDVFRAPLYFSQPISALYYEREALDFPLLHVSSDVYGGVKEELDFILSDSSWNSDPFIVGLYNAVRRQLPSGDCSVNSIARQLNVSSRTLQRRLKDRKTSFQQFVQRVKSSLAVKYLESEHLNILDISLLLGYGGPTAFAAAFKSWYGTTPSDYRSQ